MTTFWDCATCCRWRSHLSSSIFMSCKSASWTISGMGCLYRLPWTEEEVGENQQCVFPGHEVHDTVIRLPKLLKSYQADFEYGKKFVNTLHLTYNFAHRARGREVFNKLYEDYRALVNFKKNFEKASQGIYYEETIAEWLLVYLIPQLDELHSYLTRLKEVLNETDWKARPLPVVLKNYPDTI